MLQNPVQQYGHLCIILPLRGFNYHQIAPAFYMASYAISSKLHFTLHSERLCLQFRILLYLLVQTACLHKLSCC